MDEVSFVARSIKLDKFQEYLYNLENPPVNIAGELADNVRKFWKNICIITNNKVKIPIAGPTEDGFQFEWQKNNKVIIIDIYNRETFEWFFRDRETNIIYGSPAICFGIPLDFVTLLIDFFCEEKC
jgi:hypothetical protein